MFKILTIFTIMICTISVSAQRDFVIYGDFDVFDFSDLTNVPNLTSRARSVGLVVKRNRLKKLGSTPLYKVKGKDHYKTVRICDGAIPFMYKAKYGKCSSVLIGDDLLLTAGHCLANDQFACDNTSVIFNARGDLASDNKDQYFNEDQVYNCKSIVKHNISRDGVYDYAILKLDRAVKNANISPVISTDLPVEEELYMIGHPNGFLAQVSMNASVKEIQYPYYLTDLDAFGGNSGGPVYQKETGDLAGILIRGHDDFKWNSQKRCREVVKCESFDGCDGESVMDINAIFDDANT